MLKGCKQVCSEQVVVAGASVSLDTRFSSMMSRHFINILIVPTLAFKFSTSGVCGSLDNDASNDLASPEGEIFENTDAFVESCKPEKLIWIYIFLNSSLLAGRIDELTRAGAGLANSWTWNASNFHEDDVTDLSYTDPTFVPSYSLSGFTEQHILTGMVLKIS